METKIINCIHEDDLKDMMVKYGLLEDYKKGNLKCPCGNIITNDNLVGFMKIDGKPIALCHMLCVKNYEYEHKTSISKKRNS